METGDEIELDVEKRALTLCVADEEIAARLSQRKPQPPQLSSAAMRVCFWKPFCKRTKAAISIFYGSKRLDSIPFY